MSLYYPYLGLVVVVLVVWIVIALHDDTKKDDSEGKE